MVFGSEPKKMNSLKPGDKRRISLPNSDFKAVTGLESSIFVETATHTLSPVQLVAGSDRRIRHRSTCQEMPFTKLESQEVDVAY